MEPEPVADQPSISPVIPTTKPKNRIVLFIRGILILGLGFTIGLLFNKNLSPTSQVPATPTPSPIAIIDTTANWKTYADSGFSFKYPSEMVIETSSADTPDVSYLETPDYQSPGEVGYQIQITKITNDVPTVDQFMKIAPNTPEQTFLDKQNIVTINGGQVEVRTYQGGWSIYKNYYIYSPKLAVILQGTGKNHTTFDQIISTFKFDDQNTGDTTNWKTYSNSRYNFELKYPKEWEGPMKISGTNIQGQASFQGTEGAIILTWGGGFGGGLCSQKVQIIQTGMGDMGFCATHENDGSKTLKTANEGPVPQNAQYINVQFTINPPAQENEQILNQILSTFKFLEQDPNSEGKFCGGIAGNLPQNQCPSGYTCKLDGNYPDAGGRCEKP